MAMQPPRSLPSKLRYCVCNLQKPVGLSRYTLVIGRFVPYHFEFDSTNRILRCRFEGRITDEDLKDYYRLLQQYDAQVAPLAGILDMSGVTTFGVSPQTIRELADLPPAFADASRPRCIVATSPEIFGLARMFELHGESTRPNLHVVRTQNEAFAILAVRDPEFEAIELK
jgi:hypothetical protein